MSKNPKQDKDRSEQKPLSDRVDVWVKIIVAVVSLFFAALTLRHTLTGAAGEKAMERARIVLDAAELGKENPEFAEPVVQILEKSGQPEAAEALDSVVRRMHRDTKVIKPVRQPESADSSAALLARLQRQVDAQPAPPRGIIAIRLPNVQNAPVRMEAISIPRDSAATTLPSGERIGRSALMGLVEDQHGRSYCLGDCEIGMYCCRYKIGP